jgi:hypothetical protein
MSRPDPVAAPQPVSLLVSPAAKGAFFGDTLDVARVEVSGVTGDRAITHRRCGAMDFLEVDVAASEHRQLARLACIHGVFNRDQGGLQPLAIDPGFVLHEDFVFGGKYRGKTHELLTQLLINTGLRYAALDSPRGISLLDPMCGRATTLLWALRYGIDAGGVEQDVDALADIRRHLRKWSKIHRQKHRLDEGRIKTGEQRRDSHRFLHCEIAGARLRVVAGDSSHAPVLLNGQRFDLIVSDLPYGIAHQGRGGARNPLEVIQACAPAWRECLKPGGAMVLAFNANLPRRHQLIAALEQPDLVLQEFSMPHRVSESILRDVVVFTRPQPP